MGILSRLTHRKEAGAEGGVIVREGLERVIRLHPQLRLAAGFERRLTRALRVSLRHLNELISRLPPARKASREIWSADPCIHAYFAAPDDVAQVLSRSRGLRRFFEENPGADEAFAVLGMAMFERSTLVRSRKASWCARMRCAPASASLTTSFASPGARTPGSGGKSCCVCSNSWLWKGFHASRRPPRAATRSNRNARS